MSGKVSVLQKMKCQIKRVALFIKYGGIIGFFCGTIYCCFLNINLRSPSPYPLLEIVELVLYGLAGLFVGSIIGIVLYLYITIVLVIPLYIFFRKSWFSQKNSIIFSKETSRHGVAKLKK